MANTRTFEAVHTILLNNGKRVIEFVVYDTVLVCYAKIDRGTNKKASKKLNINNKKYINSRNKLCKFIKLLDEKFNNYCKCA